MSFMQIQSCAKVLPPLVKIAHGKLNSAKVMVHFVFFFKVQEIKKLCTELLISVFSAEDVLTQHKFAGGVKTFCITVHRIQIVLSVKFSIYTITQNNQKRMCMKTGETTL